jgi:arylsulfatase A-like enzyme
MIKKKFTGTSPTGITLPNSMTMDEQPAGSTQVPQCRLQRPNIVFIMTDQHHARYLNCLGRSELKTPNFDELASHSAVFNSAYTASPICGPARAAVFTGQYPLQNGIHINWIPLKKDSKLLTEQLEEAGYYNAMIGKLHLSPIKDAHGFHYRRMCDSPHDVYDKEEIVVNDYLPWAAKGIGIAPERLAALAGESELCPVGESEFWLGWEWSDNAHQMTTWTGNEAVSFINKYEKKQPMFLHVSFFGPHHPYASCEPWDSMYNPENVSLPASLHMDKDGKRTGSRFDWPDTSWREAIAKYSGQISAIDVQLGRITAALKERGLWDNTLIVFTSDHGDHMGDFSQLGKGTMLESSVRVPFFVKPPGKTIPRGDYSEVVNLIDIYPTLLDYAGVSNSKNTNHSRSIRKILTGDKSWQNQTFASFCSKDGRNGQVMMVKDKFKAVGFLEDGKMTVELYDRTDKMPDMRNLANAPAYAKISTEMQRVLEDWIRDNTVNAMPAAL